MCVSLSVSLSLCMLMCACVRERDRKNDRQTNRQRHRQTMCTVITKRRDTFCSVCFPSLFGCVSFKCESFFVWPLSGFSTSTERVTVLQYDVYGDCLSVTASLACTVDLIRVRSATTVDARLHSSETNEQVHWLISCQSTGE